MSPPCPAPVPGADDGLAQRIEAFQGDSDLPTLWTPEHVQERLIDAFEILRSAVGRVAPATFKNNWPQVYHEAVDREEFINRRGEFWEGRPPRPSAHQIALMEEALSWPLQFLGDAPMQADALTLFCSARSEDGIIAAMLRRRVEKARGMMALVERDNAARRRAIAADVSQWANDRIARLTPAQAYRANYIKANARIRFERAIKDAGGLKTKLKPKDVMPGKVMSRTRLDLNRKQGAARVASALNALEVEVR